MLLPEVSSDTNMSGTVGRIGSSLETGEDKSVSVTQQVV